MFVSRNIDVKSEITLIKGLCLCGVSKPYENRTWAKGKTGGKTLIERMRRGAPGGCLEWTEQST